MFNASLFDCSWPETAPNPGKSHRDRVSVQDDEMTAPDRPAPGRMYLWCNHASVRGLFRDDAF